MKRSISLAFLAMALLVLAPAGALSQGKTAEKAKAAAAAPLKAADILKAVNYRPIGPTQQSGRFVDFAVPLQKQNTFYAAAASGRLWKTENNGQSFEGLFENEKVFFDRRHRRGPVQSRPALAGLGRSQQFPLDLLGRRRL